MTAVLTPPGVGPLLREWRERRRLSQLALAVSAGVSARHLSFVETGRSTPSRELIVHLAGELGVPLRDRNSLLLAAGYAPVYRQTALEAKEMAPVRRALDKIVSGHEPFPAIVVDRRWELVTANGPALDILTDGVATDLLTPPVNALRVSLHPDGMAKRITNFAQWADHLLERLDRQIAVSRDADLIALAAELRDYPGVGLSPRSTALADRLFVPLVLRHANQELQFFSTVATFGTAVDITIAELAIESFFPADDVTAQALTAAGNAGTPSSRHLRRGGDLAGNRRGL